MSRDPAEFQPLQRPSDHVPNEKEIFGDPTLERTREWILSHEAQHLYGPKEISYGPNELIVACLVRNGETYIKDFIEHHLSLGVRHIVFLDNGSEDETVSVAREHENVTVLQSRLPFKRYKQAARRYLIRRFGRGRWCLYADVDELFDYPFSDVIGLDSLLRYLNENSYTAVVSYMLDMFSDKPLSFSTEGEPRSLKETHRYYDLSDVHANNYRDDRGVVSNVVSNEEIRSLRGGVQLTLFGHSPLLTKHPLVFGDDSLEFSHVFPHWIGNARIADFTGVLYHYKFVDRFRERALRAVREGGYALNSAKYRRYLSVLDQKPELYPRQASSSRLESVNDLVDEGFLAVSEEYMSLVDEEEEKTTDRERLRDRPSRLVKAFSTARTKTRALDLTVERLNIRISNLEHELAEKRQKTRWLLTENRDLSTRLENNRKHLASRNDQLSRLRSSKSWKLLYLLRRIKTTLLGSK